MAWKRMIIVALLCTCCFAACAETLEPLDMDSCEPGPVPQDASYISDTEYQDESISVKLYSGRYAQTDYVCAHVKISHPSQLRTATSNSSFRDTSEGTTRGRIIAEKVNAVVAINGDYFIKTDKCQVVLRQSQQVRNHADGHMDLLVIDMNGDLSVLPNCTKQYYKEFNDQNRSQLYNIFCFGPMIVQDGVSVIPAGYKNNSIGAQKSTQRSAIAQLGTLEYMLVSTNGPQSPGNKGMTLEEFAHVCEDAGKRLNENGCRIAYNMDGGNSAAMIFREMDPVKGTLQMKRVNSFDISERHLSDIIYFATLVK